MIGNRLVVARGWRRGQEVTAKGFREGDFWSNGNVLDLDIGDGYINQNNC